MNRLALGLAFGLVLGLASGLVLDLLLMNAKVPDDDLMGLSDDPVTTTYPRTYPWS